jgi:hypothetical protein
MTKLMLAGLSLSLLGTPSLAREALAEQTGFAQSGDPPVITTSEAPKPELGGSAPLAPPPPHLTQLIRLHMEAVTPWLADTNP